MPNWRKLGRPQNPIDPLEARRLEAMLPERPFLFAVAALALWLLIFDWPYWTILTAMLLAPFPALAALIPLRGRFADLPPQDRPTLFGLTMLAPLVLYSGTNYAGNFIDGAGYDSALVLLAIAFFALAFITSESAWARALRRFWVLSIVPLYIVGAVKLLDVELDTSEPATYRTAVIEKEPPPFRSPSFDYQLRMKPWGPGKITSAASVTSGVYRSVETGSTVCVHLHDGALGLRWYDVANC
jgi:hypothetical protein